ncbi:MAG: DUF6438 domain-containing protein [Chitinophagales bacterium]
MNKIQTILILTTAIFFWQCGSAKKTVKTDDKKIQLEKIIFHTSICFGSCPTYHLQVDKDKNIKLYAEHVYKTGGRFYEDDSTKTGYFIGKADDSTFDKLINELNTIGLDSLQFRKANCCDGSIKTIIVYYNGKRKFMKSMFPPEEANELIDILYDICHTKSLKRSAEEFEVESEE